MTSTTIQSSPVLFKPCSFVVAWHGVLTLEFCKWPVTMANIKTKLSKIPKFRDQTESFGSRWPKITLAALKDDAPPITQETFERLMFLLDQWKPRLQKLPAIQVESISLVEFDCRSLENIQHLVDVSLMQQHSSTLENPNIYQQRCVSRLSRVGEARSAASWLVIESI